MRPQSGYRGTPRQQQAANTNAVTSGTSYWNHDNTEDEFRTFQDMRILQPGTEDHFMSLDHVDAQAIVMGAYRGASVNSGSANAATRTRERDGTRIDYALERVQQSNVQKPSGSKRGRPSRINNETPTVRTTTEDQAEGMARIVEGEEDELSVPFASQAHENPFSIIKPPTASSDFWNLSADPDLISQGRRRRVNFDNQDGGAIQELVQPHPNRLVTAMLK